MKTRKEIVDYELTICSDVSNWCLREGFDIEFLKLAWSEWLDELYALRWSGISTLTVPNNYPARRTGVNHRENSICKRRSKNQHRDPM